MSEPKISVIMSVWNCERFVGEAIESILGQSRPADEVFVVDDGSTDGTAAVVRRFAGVTYLHQPNSGQAAAFNRAIALAKGELVCFLDADDRWPHEKLALQLTALQADPTLDVVYGMAQEFRGDTSVGGPVPALVAGAMMIRAGKLAQVGGFDTTYRLGCIVEWYARARDAGLTQRVLDQVLLERRLHDANLGITAKDHRTEYLRIVKASLDRRRATQGK